MKRRHLLTALPALLAGAALPTVGWAQATPLPYPQRDEVRAYIDELVATRGLEREWVEKLFAQARYNETAEKLTTPGQLPPSSRNWLEYRARNVDERRIREGLNFLRQNNDTLERAQTQFGVPAEIVVAIIGIETLFGRTMGSHRTLDVLLTLAFDYPRRAALYREELAQFLLLCREQKLDPLAQRGSFAGALGLPQFMPGSVRRFAVDFDGDGRVDLMRSTQDAIGSVGHFLAEHGWQREVPIQFEARANREVVNALGRGIRALYRWSDLAALGVTIAGELEPETRVLLLDLDYVTPRGDEGTEFRVGTVNLSALLHYNRSYFYGTAVADLAGAIRSRASA